jgi:Ca2+-binding RTX toxin-like protein
MATLNGSEGNDRILGTKSSDTINGRGGDDEIYGYDGDDYFSDREGLNLIYGGLGADSFNYSHGRLYGEEGNDRFVILMNGSVTEVFASGGEDDDFFQVSQGMGADGLAPNMALCTIEGGDGVDTLTLSLGGDSRGAYQLLLNTTGIEVLFITHGINLSGDIGYAMSDNFIGAGKTLLVQTEGDFNRTIDFSNETDGSLIVDFRDISLFGASGSTGQSTSKIYGGAQNDIYWGNVWIDIFKGGQGDDFFNGGDAKDIAVFSGRYSDYTITEITYNTFLIKDNVGTDGSDTIVDVNQLQFSDMTFNVLIRGMEIIGDESSEEITGGDEADRLLGAGGDDKINGGSGHDLIEGGTGSDSIAGGNGNDFLYGGVGSDTLIGSNGNDSVDAGDGDDLIIGGDGAGDDTYVGGEGIDTVKYLSAVAGIVVNLVDGIAESKAGDDLSGIGRDTLSSIENVIAGNFSDLLIGNQFDNKIFGLDGDDRIISGGGNDQIFGGNGVDTAVLNFSKQSIQQVSQSVNGEVLLIRTEAEQIYLEGMEWVELNGDVISSSLLTGIENTPLFISNNASGYVEPSIYEGPVSFLEYQYLGNETGDIVTGSTSNDFMNLFGGDDAADGGAGSDVLDGGTGSNFLTGGIGNDTFFLDGRGGTVTWSTITDFSKSNGDQVNIWGWQDGLSRLLLSFENSGAEGYTGATYHFDLDGNNQIDTSITFAGIGLDGINSPASLEVAGNGYLFFG